jgi:restriction system protein
MARRRESGIDVLLILPWWVSATLAVVAYLLLTYAAPAYFSANPFTAGISQGLVQLKPLVCGLLAFLAVISFVRGKLIARKFDQQKSIEDIRSLSWRQFESIVGEAFRRRGYTVIENAVDGPDGGVDLVLRKDGAKFYVQCKQWKQLKVGVKPVRELFGVVSASAASGGFFVCSGSYTEEAKAFAKQSGIELIDGAELQRMMEAARTPEPFLDPTESRRRTARVIAAPAAPSCPSCGGEMIERVAKRGATSGSKFWGCLAYPRCRGTRMV